MELIKRYLYAIGKKLPKKQREDIERELESSIYDNLEDAYGQKDEYTDDEIESILKKLGSPGEVAGAYRKSGNYLIGPELLLPYYMIIKIVAAAVTLGILISFVVGLFQPDQSIKDLILEFLGLIPSTIVGIMTAIGFITVIFYLFEHYIPGFRVEDMDPSSEWHIKDLPHIPVKSEKISLAESIIGVVFTVIAIVLFNFFSSNLGIYYTNSLGEGWEFIQIFSMDAIRTYLPYWNAVWIISFIFHVFCMVQRKWNVKTRLFDIFNSLLAVGILAMMIKGPELIDIRLLIDSASAGVAESLTPIAKFFKYSLDGIFIFALVATIIGIISKTVKLFTSIVKNPAEK